MKNFVKHITTLNGSVLIFSIIILSIILVASLSVVSVSVLERKSSGSTAKSVQSFNVAQSGVELALEKIRKGGYDTLGTLLSNWTGATCSGGVLTATAAGGTFSLTFKDTSETTIIVDCADTTTRIGFIRSLGTSSGTSRAVEVAVGARCNGTISDSDGNLYDLVKIGTQCWMKQNMRIGTRINVGTAQTNNGILEKYCYSNSDTSCTALHPNQPDGGLYQWDEAMQYSTAEGAQGICPSGFHIPTDAELYILENYLKDSGQTCNANRVNAFDCSSAANKLKPGGTSNFEWSLAGCEFSNLFIWRDTVGYIWSSSESGINAWYRFVESPTDTVYRNMREKTLGFSVRCIQN